MREHGIRGFTLVEVLVVVALIAVLASLIYVLLAPAREAGRRTVCLNNLKQIGQAIVLYRQDWGGVAPQPGLRLSMEELGLPPWDTRFGCDPPPGYTDPLCAYIRNKQVWWCPSRFASPRWREDPGAVSSYGFAWTGVKASKFAAGIADENVDYRILGVSADGSVRWWRRQHLRSILWARP